MTVREDHLRVSFLLLGRSGAPWVAWAGAGFHIPVMVLVLVGGVFGLIKRVMVLH